MNGEVRKRVEREVGSVNRMMSIGRFLENKGRMLQGGGESALLELHTGKKAKGGGRSTSWEVQERLKRGSLNGRWGSKVEFILRRREGRMGRGNWWMLASPVQAPRKGKGGMEGLSLAWQASTGSYRSILEQSSSFWVMFWILYPFNSLQHWGAISRTFL